MAEPDFAFIIEIARLGWPLAVIRWRMHFETEWEGW